ncbi:hypothetical protein ABIE67_001210 [Streptomyces sp. V4I8]
MPDFMTASLGQQSLGPFEPLNLRSMNGHGGPTHKDASK